MSDTTQETSNTRHWFIVTFLSLGLFAVWFFAGGVRWEGYPCFAWKTLPAVRIGYLVVLLATVIYFCQLLVNVIVTPENFHRKTILPAMLSFVLLRIVIGSALPLLGDEAYHWIWPQKLDWCYYDHGGLLGWVMYPFRLMGKNVFFARLGPILMGTITAIIVWYFTRRLTGDRRIANVALAGLMMLPVGLIGTTILFTDTPLAPLWLGAMWVTLLALREQKIRWWILLGFILGLGFNSKFLIFGLIIMLGIYLLLDPRGRNCLKTPGPYLAMTITLILSIPLVWWNATHHWQTFLFNFGKRGDALGFYPAGLIGFSIQQIMLVGPVLLIWSFYYPAIWARRKFRQQQIEPIILVLGGYVPFMTYAILKLLRPLNTSVINWTAPLFAILVIILAWASTESIRNRKWCKVTLHAGAVVSCLFVGGFTSQFFIGPDPLRQAFAPVVKEKNLNRYLADMFGWYPVGQELDLLLEQFNRERPTFIMARTYMHAAHFTQYCQTIPLALSMGNDAMYGRCFDYWNEPEKHLGNDALFVANHPISSRIEKELRASFDTVDHLSPDERKAQAWINKVFHIYHCRNARELPGAADVKK
ncbi:MAG: glycosyltransferase family 39 protein [Phycisphaerae bacterium]|nr:glycosyltransferase family 39 protein [Phycisphaerae bacterium]